VVPDAKVTGTDDKETPLFTGTGIETELEMEFKPVACPIGTGLPPAATEEEEVGPSDFETFPIAVATSI